MTAPTSISHEEEALNKAFDLRLARRLLALVRPYRWQVAGALGLLLAVGTLQLVGPLMTRRVIDVAIPAKDSALIVQSTLILLAALLAQVIGAYFETVVTGKLGQRVMHDLRRRVFAQLQRLPVTFFDRNPVGRLVTRVTNDVESLNELFTSGVVAGIGDLFTLVAITVLMLVVDWRLALAAYLVVPGILWVSAVFRKRVRTEYREIRTKLARINAFLQERIAGIRVVQLFGREADEAARFREIDRSHLAAHLRSVTVYAMYFPAIEILTTVALAALILAAAPRVEAGGLTVGTLAAFLQLARRFYQPLQDLSDKYNTLQQAMAASERIFKLLDETPEPERAGEGPDRPAATLRADAVQRHGVTVAFEDVWFAYDLAHVASGAAAPAEPEWVLRGVSFSVRPGETLALVGHTGAGKTTVINLLLRFYEPQRGRILVDGVDIRQIPLDELRRAVGYVQQDIFLFADDIATNIRLSTPLTDAEVASAAARVGADRIVARLPDGYRQRLGERGSSLSVGERQLLSFARAIAADPALLVLDEATSSVDSEVEAQIQRGLDVLMQGRTTIAVAHRLSTITRATEILVMHHGEVRERGSHRSLLSAGGLYARLYRLQAGELATAS
ncbi:ABC transporter ATP-binding protein [Pseudogemmatithrix spongiicola]|uniref:ABC transporter ATP-binding protein n=1 Tax=Pseudogemmatithrix spongiicola TaxID=3062599 RepID=A0AA49Q8D0_9BACT|nr:ABC transporter ATP-binding protein [Gemmatimonadaceae bacterium 'strain 138']WKW15629.1 ABC transporter ATP-binding protein [Gemmatimonadaceae bacterium 'strain 318']